MEDQIGRRAYARMATFSLTLTCGCHYFVFHSFGDTFKMERLISCDSQIRSNTFLLNCARWNDTETVVHCSTRPNVATAVAKPRVVTCFCIRFSCFGLCSVDKVPRRETGRRGIGKRERQQREATGYTQRKGGHCACLVPNLDNFFSFNLNEGIGLVIFLI